MGQKVDKDAYPMCVVVVDGDTEYVVEERVQAATLRVHPKPRERVVAEKGAPREEG